MSYISEDDRIDREQAYRRKLREAAAVRQFRTARSRRRATISLGYRRPRRPPVC